MYRTEILLSSLFLYNLILFNNLPANAQITPDSTLGNESSQINSNVLIKGGNADQINGGATRGSNLFHSFSEFNINDGQRVYFANPSGVINILTRVTGNNSSSILGTLGVDGSANLFLMNPNGILFGKNASLDVQGSFIGTTANGLKFGNQGVFSATNPQAPALLTINPSALSFSQQQSGAITNQSQAPAGINPDGNPATGLRVPDGKSLLLVGGNINSDGGRFRAYDGRVELTGLAAPGDIGLNVAGDNISLNIPNDASFADVFLGNVSAVSVFGDKGGEIAINARNIGIDNSFLFAGISAGKGTPTTQARDINLNATGSISISQNSFIDNSVTGNGKAGSVFVRAKDAITVDSSGIYSNVDATGIGSAGNINIKSASLNLKNGASLTNGIFGQGNAGNTLLEISDGIQLSNAFIFNNIAAGGVGNGGEININGGSLSLTDSSQIQSKIEEASGNLAGGRGNTGNININVKGNISFTKPIPGQTNGIVTLVGVGAIGNAGNLTINADSLEIKEGSEIQGSTRGKGNAGNITINTRDSVVLDGRDGEKGIFSRILTTVQPGAEGNAGNINVNTGNLKITNGAFLSSATLGKGDAGNITADVRDATKLENRGVITSDVSGVGNGGDIRLNTGTLFMTAGSLLSTNALGQGNAGNITVNARETITLDDVTGDKLTGIQSGLLQGVGKAGNIDITTGSLFAINGAALLASSDGQGNAGNITINVRDVVSFDTSVGNRFASQIGNEVGSDGVGNGGDIRITAREISFKNGSNIGASSFGRGNAGNIIIDAKDKVSFDGVGGSFKVSSGANTITAKEGQGGDISVKTGTLSLTNGAQIDASTSGKGNGGNITIDVRDRINVEGIGSNERFSGVFSLVQATGVGKGGNINVNADSLIISDRARISASTFGQGDAGQIFLNINNALTLNEGYIVSSVASGGVGNAGDIDIKASTLSATEGSQIQSALFRPSKNLPGARGRGGNIRINVTDAVTLSGYGKAGFSSGLITVADRETSGNAGNITVATSNFKVTDGAVVIAGTSATGNGGDIIINAKNFAATNGGLVSTNTRGSGNAGSIKLNVTDKITIAGSDPNFSDRVAKVTQRLQQPGETDQLKDVILNQGAESGLFANTEVGSTGRGGSIFIDPPQINITDGAKVSVNSDGTGDAGNISIIADSLRLDNGATISAQTASSQGGNINLELADYLFLRRGSFISTTAGTAQAGGDGGNITINTPFIVGISKENSDITANAFTGKGGNINIQTQNIFGIAASPKPTNQSDITASSEVGVQGQVSITKPDVDPNRGLIDSPEGFKDKSDELNQLCGRDGRPLGRFVVTGRGVIRPNPLDLMQGGNINESLATLDNSNYTVNGNSIPDNLTAKIPPVNSIVEAQAIVRGADGTLYLVADAPNVKPRSRPEVSACANVGK